jgi:hypothetical protein
VVHPASTALGQSLQPPLTQSFFKGQQKCVALHCALFWQGLQNSTLSAAVHSPATHVFGPEMSPGAEVRGVTFLDLSQQFPESLVFPYVK